MKGHFIDAQVFAEGSEQSNQGLPDGAGANDVNNAFVISHLCCYALSKRSMNVTLLFLLSKDVGGYFFSDHDIS